MKIAFIMNDELYARLRKMASDDNRTISGAVRFIVENFVRQHTKDDKRE